MFLISQFQDLRADRWSLSIIEFTLRHTQNHSHRAINGRTSRQEYIIEKEGEYPTSLWVCVTTLYGGHDLTKWFHRLSYHITQQLHQPALVLHAHKRFPPHSSPCTAVSFGVVDQPVLNHSMLLGAGGMVHRHVTDLNKKQHKNTNPTIVRSAQLHVLHSNFQAKTPAKCCNTVHSEVGYSPSLSIIYSCSRLKAIMKVEAGVGSRAPALMRNKESTFAWPNVTE